MKKSKLYFIAVVLFAGSFVTLIRMQSPDAVFSSSAQKTSSSQPTPPKNSVSGREKVNTDKLKLLLENEAVEVSDANLLASPSEKSKTLRVRLKTIDFTAEKDLSEKAASRAEISLLSLKRNGDATSRMRALELSPTQILIVSLDGQNRLVWWQTQPDPRLFRAETADDGGRLSGAEKYLETAEMLFSLPDEEKISKIRFYHPQWDGARFNLKLVGSLDLKSE